MNIQNKAYIQFLEDGSQLHYELRSTKSLVQSGGSGACVPDWTQPDNQPTIWLSLLNGSTPIAPDSGFTWTYNGTTITFGSDGKSTNQGFAGIFQQTTHPLGTGLPTMPGLKIIGNLADLSDTVDIDVIGFNGTKTIVSNPVAFACNIFIQISEFVKGGYVGLLEYADGKSTIDAPNDTVTLNSKLFDQSGVVVNNCTRAWYLNETAVTSTTVSTTNAYLTNNGASIVVPEKAVVDNAVVRCVFSVDSVERAAAYASIDDTQDPEYMWVRNATNSGSQAVGNAASLRDGDTVIWQCYVSTATAPEHIDTSWMHFYVKLLDSTNTVITANISGVPNIHGSGAYAEYRDITTNVTSGTPTGTMGQVSIGYSSKELAKNGMTLLFLATTTAIW